MHFTIIFLTPCCDEAYSISCTHKLIIFWNIPGTLRRLIVQPNVATNNTLQIDYDRPSIILLIGIQTNNQLLDLNISTKHKCKHKNAQQYGAFNDAHHRISHALSRQTSRQPTTPFSWMQQLMYISMFHICWLNSDCYVVDGMYAIIADCCWLLSLIAMVQIW